MMPWWWWPGRLRHSLCRLGRTSLPVVVAIIVPVTRVGEVEAICRFVFIAHPIPVCIDGRLRELAD